jgi:large subunit ribosomal protein L1
MPSKRFQQAKDLIEKGKIYSLDEAVALVKKTATSKFDEAIEFHARLGIDTKKSDQQVRGTISFPHSIGKSKKVIAFVEPAKEAEAKEAGADIVGGEELIASLAQSGTIDFDVAVAMPSMMPKLAKLAKILGPRGLMPNPKTETVGPNIKKMVEEQKAGKESFKSDVQGNLHQIFGRASLSEAQLKENLTLLIDTLKRLKPPSSKGIYFQSVTIASTMGPGIKIEITM